MRETLVLEKLLSEYPVTAGVFCSHEPKSDGSTRPIIKPNKELNAWLKKVKRALYTQRKDWPVFIHGGVKNRSYVSYARPHTNKKTVISIDIRDCFGSITQKDVANALQNKLQFPQELAQNLATRLCYKGKLPQGYATSNFLTNLYLNDTLLKINRLLSKEKIDMSIYVDDIALSSQRIESSKVINLVVTELSRSKLAINKAKIKVMHSHMPQIICGLVVNKGVSLSRKREKQLFSDIANGRMSESSLKGWLANLNMFDTALMLRLRNFAIKKGLVSKTF